MHLVQILLPLNDNAGSPFPEEILRDIHSELADRFGGLTAHSRAPAKGVWGSGAGRQKDDIVIVEVMADSIDEIWWRTFRKPVEKLLEQSELVIRSQEFRKL